ncbi:hypothetical protein FDUTEX481_03354 [Tolypothrix sp. PCC 7601]|nr:hypothetical protein FDUTEX481_03354 [Tolypothrix sp. PCC 7601]
MVDQGDRTIWLFIIQIYYQDYGRAKDETRSQYYSVKHCELKIGFGEKVKG